MNLSILIAFILGFTFILTAVEESASPAPAAKIELKKPILNIRWKEEKFEDGKRVVSVYIKNQGRSDLKNVDLDILLKGKGLAEAQMLKVRITVPKGYEVRIPVPLSTNSSGTDGKFFGIPLSDKKAIKPMSEMHSVEVMWGDQKFTSVLEEPSPNLTPKSLHSPY